MDRVVVPHRWPLDSSQLDRERLEAFCRHRDAEAFAALVATHRGMVEKVCRRHLVLPADLDDAVQETFVKLARKAQMIEGDIAAWLRAAAGTTALDFARRYLRRRAHLRTLRDNPQEAPSGQPGLAWGLLEKRLDEALGGLDPAMRSLVIARFFEQTAVQELAQAEGVTPSAVSRRVSRAVTEMRRALAKMGYHSLEDAVLGCAGSDPPKGSRGVMWLNANGARPETAAVKREVRVGVFVSHSALTRPNFEGYIPSMERQLKLVLGVAPDRYRLIALVEPGTEEYPMVERAAREFSLTAGMLEATDPEALDMLDVIFLGELQVTSGRVLQAVGDAVERGVGLFNGGLVGSTLPGFTDPQVKRLFMTKQLGMCHTLPKHGTPHPATINAPHPLLAPLEVGTKLMIYGCAPVFMPEPTTRTYMTFDAMPDNMDPYDADLMRLRVPVFTLGNLGKGRVAIVSIVRPEPLATHPAFGGRFMMNIIDYLAQPRLAERAAWGV